MADYQNDRESKRRKLDELFADEPFLSPTMRARRLHEKLQQLQDGDRAAQGLPTEAYVVDRNASSVAHNAPLDPVQPEEMVQFADAVRYLRGEGSRRLSAMQIAQLQRFRNGLLLHWKKLG